MDIGCSCIRASLRMERKTKMKIRAAVLMRPKLHLLFITLALFVCEHQVGAQGTGFSYQGQLQNNGSPANGSYDLMFTLFNTTNNGVAIAGPVINSGTAAQR